MDKKFKDKIIKKYQTHKSDTGSPEVQIALLTEEMKQLAEHLKIHKKDFSSRRGLVRKVNERRRLLRYLEREDRKRFDNLAKKLKLKVAKKIADRRLEIEEERRLAEEAKMAFSIENESGEGDEYSDKNKKEKITPKN